MSSYYDSINSIHFLHWHPLLFKELRARIIVDYVIEAASYKGIVCFSCGHASAAIEKLTPDCISIAPGGILQTNKWWKPEEIHRAWPEYFDATSGHLPMPLMVRLASAYKLRIGALKIDKYKIPCGSGETILALGIAYPEVKFIAEYDNRNPATTWNEGAPLNSWVAAQFPISILNKQ